MSQIDDQRETLSDMEKDLQRRFQLLKRYGRKNIVTTYQRKVIDNYLTLYQSMRERLSPNEFGRYEGILLRHLRCAFQEILGEQWLECDSTFSKGIRVLGINQGR